jgi:hypothetical protein
MRIFLRVLSVLSFVCMMSNAMALKDNKNNLQSNPTQIIVFKPSLTVQAVKKGYCWTSSLKTARTDAWRCMIGNAIQDPCFTTTQSNIVACGMNPEAGDPGFALELTQALPKVSRPVTADNLNAGTYPKTWMVKLADGSVCSPFTGTLAEVNGQNILYACHDAKLCEKQQDCELLAGLLTIDTQTQPWKAIKVIYKPALQGVQVQELKTVPVATAWE